MNIKLPIVGQIRTGKDADPQVKTVQVPVKEKSVLLGSFLDFFQKKLSNEKSVSSKLLETYAEWVYANVSALGEEVSKLEPQLFKTVLKGGTMDLEEVDSHPLLDLLDRFNDSTTRSDAFYVTETHLELTGDAFYLVEGPKSQPTNLFILQPDHMELKLGDYRDSSSRLIDGYKYSVTVDGKSQEVNYAPDEIIHIKVPNPKNPYRGQSVVEAAAKTLDTDEATTEALINFFRNGMIANFALTTEQRLTSDQIKDLQAQIRSARTGVRNAFKVPILSGGLDVKQLQMSNKEIELIELEKWFRDKIMAMFKNTKTSLGITEDVNRANAEASQLSWKRNVVIPKMARITDALNEFLVPRYGDNLILGFKDPIPEDRGTKAKELVELVTSGILTVDEAREELEYEPITEGDTEIPKALRHINYKSVFRRQGWHGKLLKHKDLYLAARDAAETIVKNRKQKVEPKRPSNRRVMNFWKRVAQIIEELEFQFRPKIEQAILSVAEEAITNVGDESARSNGELFDREAKIAEITSRVEPILTNAVALAGQQANNLLGIKEPYVPKQIKQNDVLSQVRAQIELFAASMLDTDKDILADIIATGLKEGSGIPLIRKAIQDKFAEFSKSQAERITRTEVAWAANRGIVDSYRRSGVVVAKQWLTAPDACSYCAPMNGQIVGLEETYFDEGSEWLGNAETPLKLDYRDVEEPPLHPNCRCTVISVIEGLDPLIEAGGDIERIKDIVGLKTQIAELEAKVDKRTKAYRKLKASKTEDEEYIKQLEELVDAAETPSDPSQSQKTT